MPSDAFLSYNNQDRQFVTTLCEALRAHQVSVWVDLDIEPGESFVSSINSALLEVRAVLVCLGGHGFGKWQELEIEAALSMNREHGTRIIPLRIPGAPEKLVLPPLLSGVHALDLRAGVDDESLLQSIGFAILGTGPDTTLPTALVFQAHQSDALPPPGSSAIDAYGVATLKERLHAASEVIANAAAGQAARAGDLHAEDSISFLIPLLYDLGWRRAYVEALNRMLPVPQGMRSLSAFSLRAIEGTPDSSGGLLSATIEERTVTIRLDGNPVAQAECGEDEDTRLVLDAINAYGRLGSDDPGVAPLMERLAAVPVPQAAGLDPDAAWLHRNREALYPLFARYRVAGLEWLLPDSEDFPAFAPSGTNFPAAVTPSAPPESRLEIFSARRSLDIPAVAVAGPKSPG